MLRFIFVQYTKHRAKGLVQSFLRNLEFCVKDAVSPLAGKRYLKMNGAGNAITVLDLMDSDHIVTEAEAQTIALNDETTFDQLMVLHKPQIDGTHAFMRIYNTDGSLSGACGNGTRCVAWYLTTQKSMPADNLVLQTSAGIISVVAAENGEFTVNMGRPKFGWEDIPLSEPFQDTRFIELMVGPVGNPILHSPSVVNMGNPHAVFWVDDVNAIDLARIGPVLENHPLFPERANISTAQIIDRQTVLLRVWERGAGLTLACGSAACAVAVCGVRLRKLDRDVDIHLPGGKLHIHWRKDESVLMTGPVELEREAFLVL
jgi:diaminopimelate epimerase